MSEPIVLRRVGIRTRLVTSKRPVVDGAGSVNNGMRTADAWKDWTGTDHVAHGVPNCTILRLVGSRTFPTDAVHR
jgi:hypothetical protein